MGDIALGPLCSSIVKT